MSIYPTKRRLGILYETDKKKSINYYKYSKNICLLIKMIYLCGKIDIDRN